jgi:transcriptional regulator with PAS, ATPase and Fis domain
MTMDGFRLTGTTAAMRALVEDIEFAAGSDAKVLITGESGAGKEVVARLIHHRSRRAAAPLVTINCAGFPDTLLESELFGHVRGSFTGAYRDKPGLLERAHGGTAFLDEIGEMSARMQALLLRFLETGEAHRVGADTLQAHLDVRLIAATNRDLVERMSAREFRQDLYYRLNVIHLTVPPLRDRVDEIAPLAMAFLDACCRASGTPVPQIGDDVLERLVSYEWPGNIRELKNAIEWVAVRARKSTIARCDLPPALLGSRPQPAPPPDGGPARADLIYERIVKGGDSFWSAAYAPFMARDITRADLRQLVAKGLEDARGSYKVLVERFNMKPSDQKRFLAFLRKFDCHIALQKLGNYRTPGAPVGLGELERWRAIPHTP